jgi:hypothetical protein
MTTRTTAHPSTPPPLSCVVCENSIAAGTLHGMPGRSLDVLCPRCVTLIRLHSRYWPGCEVGWHDLFDHPLHFRRRDTAWATIRERTAR